MREVIFQSGKTEVCKSQLSATRVAHARPPAGSYSGDFIVTKLFATAFVALSMLAGVAASAQAGYFGSTKEAQQGQHQSGFFGQLEKSGI